jgi:hypothetical protein
MKHLVWNRHTKLVLKHIAGWFFIVAGVIMLITPGQGILTIVIGIFLLADHIPLFGRIRDRIRLKFPRLTAYVHRKSEQFHHLFHHHSDESAEK